MLCAAGTTTLAAPAPIVEPPKAIPLQLSGLLTLNAPWQNTERMSPAPKHRLRSRGEAAEFFSGHHQGNAEG